MKNKIGFIGFGNMAGAIAGGILRGGQIPPEKVAAFDVFSGACAKAKEKGFSVYDDARELVRDSEYVFLCVKPQNFPELLGEIKDAAGPEHIFLTIAAGVSIAAVSSYLGNVPVLRAMPNTPMLLGCGAVALTRNSLVQDEQFAFVRSIFTSVGAVYELPENLFNEVINVNGSTPAYVYLFAKIIVDYAEASGISAEIALPMFCDTMVGSAKMLTESGKTPQELIDMVSSKGGTTVAALDAFARTGLRESLEAGMTACLNRARELNA